ncbi:hypothetical protein ABD91_21190 [Lysinibacillus sphaericus]|uniref:hypothetical protein n=1 Tax=Lysinibacillus sphaericus TaxID=1421 RepID=UPI0018CD0FFD|nr:hypothetical protein [Lysinibacillus sphaericus]MBG9693255.1 hypothetical protein [Lysinibacillus sphaericus]
MVVKSKIDGKEGAIRTVAFSLYFYHIALSYSKVTWHKGKEFKDKWIWKGELKGIPAVFVGKLAILYKRIDRK